MVVLGTTAALSIGAFLVTVVEHRPMYWVDYLLRTQSFPLWCLQLASNVICGPLVEEIVFRGVLQSFLTNRFGSSVAIAIVAVVFGLAHYAQGAMGAVQVAMLTVVGLALGILRHRFHSIGPSYAVHGLYNLSLGLLEFHAPP
jgi:membrane protease YdiL (CAAX protease family)